MTTLHAFSETDSRFPVDLFAASDGNVYGLTAGGGDFGNGTIFVIDPGGSFTTIHSIPLSAGRRHDEPRQGERRPVLRHRSRGGVDSADPFGTIFTIDDAGTATILHSFGGFPNGDGSWPEGLIQARDGRLYGTTRSVAHSASEPCIRSISTGDYRVLHSFSPTVDGSGPGPDLLEASDGNLYGVTRTLPRCSGSIRAGP